MVNLVKLRFDITLACHDELVDDLGSDLAVWLKESWFNGDDILDVEYKGYKIIC